MSNRDKETQKLNIALEMLLFSSNKMSVQYYIFILVEIQKANYPI